MSLQEAESARQLVEDVLLLIGLAGKIRRNCGEGWLWVIEFAAGPTGGVFVHIHLLVYKGAREDLIRRAAKKHLGHRLEGFGEGFTEVRNEAALLAYLGKGPIASVDTADYLDFGIGEPPMWGSLGTCKNYAVALEALAAVKGRRLMGRGGLLRGSRSNAESADYSLLASPSCSSCTPAEPPNRGFAADPEPEFFEYEDDDPVAEPAEDERPRCTTCGAPTHALAYNSWLSPVEFLRDFPNWVSPIRLRYQREELLDLREMFKYFDTNPLAAAKKAIRWDRRNRRYPMPLHPVLARPESFQTAIERERMSDEPPESFAAIDRALAAQGTAVA